MRKSHHHEEKGKGQVRKRGEHVQRPQSRTELDLLKELIGSAWVWKQASKEVCRG